MSSIYHFTGNLLSFNTAVCVDCIAEGLGLEVFDRAYNSFSSSPVSTVGNGCSHVPYSSTLLAFQHLQHSNAVNKCIVVALFITLVIGDLYTVP